MTEVHLFHKYVSSCFVFNVFFSFICKYLFTCQSVHKHVLSSYYVNNTMIVTVLLPAGPIQKLT